MTEFKAEELPSCGGLLSATSSAWDSNNSRLVAASGRHVRVYSIQSKPPRPLSLVGHSSTVVAVGMISPARALTAAADGTLRVWDAEDGICLRTFDVGEHIYGIAVPAYGSSIGDGRVLVACRNKTYALQLQKHRPTSSFRVPVWANSTASRIACDESGLFVCGIDGKTLHISLRVVEYRKEEIDLQGHANGISKSVAFRDRWPMSYHLSHIHDLTSVAVSPNGAIVAVGCDNGEIYVYRDILDRLTAIGRKSAVGMNELAPARLHWHAGAVSALCFSEGSNVLLSGGGEAVLVQWKMSRAEFGEKSFRPRLGGAIWGIAASPDATRYAITCADNAIRVLSAFSMAMEVSFQGLFVPHHADMGGCTKSVHGRDMLLANLKDMSLIPEPRTDGNVWVYGAGSSIQVYNVFSGQHVAFIPVIPRNVIHIAPDDEETRQMPSLSKICHVCISPDAQHFVTVDSQELRLNETGLKNHDGLEVLRFWHRNGNRGKMDMLSRVEQPHGPGGRICDVDFHPSMAIFATASSGGDFKIWRLVYSNRTQSTLSLRCETVGGHRRLSCGAVAFSLDGSLLAVGCGSVVCLWRVCHLQANVNKEDSDDGQSGKKDDCISETSPCSLRLEMLHSFVHPPSDEHVTNLKFMGTDEPFLVATTARGLYVWHVLGQCVWWTMRLCTLGKPIVVDLKNNRFAVAIEIPQTGQINRQFNDSATSNWGDMKPLGFVEADLSIGSDPLRVKSEDGAVSRSLELQTQRMSSEQNVVDISSDETMAKNSAVITNFPDKSKNESGGLLNNYGKNEPLGPSAAVTASRAIQQLKKKPFQAAEGRKTPVSSAPHNSVNLDWGSQSATTKKGIVDGVQVRQSQNSKLPNVLGRNMDSALAIFTTSSPTPLHVHSLRDGSGLLAATFVGASALSGHENAPLLFVDHSMDVHTVTSSCFANIARAATGNIDSQTSIAVGTDNSRKLGDLLGHDWKSVQIPHPPRPVPSGSSFDFQMTASRLPSENRSSENSAVGIISRMFVGGTHTLAPVSVTGLNVIQELSALVCAPSPSVRETLSNDQNAYLPVTTRNSVVMDSPDTILATGVSSQCSEWGSDFACNTVSVELTLAGCKSRLQSFVEDLKQLE